MATISWEDFAAVDLRVGRIVLCVPERDAPLGSRLA